MVARRDPEGIPMCMGKSGEALLPNKIYLPV